MRQPDSRLHLTPFLEFIKNVDGVSRVYFNGFIPLVAIQMQALRFGDQFTTVLNEVRLGLVDEDEEGQEVTDRAYWEKRGTKATLEITDSLLRLVNEFAPDLTLKYNKFYIRVDNQTTSSSSARRKTGYGLNHGLTAQMKFNLSLKKPELM